MAENYAVINQSFRRSTKFEEIEWEFLEAKLTLYLIMALRERHARCVRRKINQTSLSTYGASNQGTPWMTLFVHAVLPDPTDTLLMGCCNTNHGLCAVA